jgi:hypothetical protein
LRYPIPAGDGSGLFAHEAKLGSLRGNVMSLL